jgi:hypothetical protein
VAAEAPQIYAEHTWDSFVRRSVRFKCGEPNTKSLATRMMPYFPKSCRVIAAYLDDADQAWKVSYHWELLSKRVKLAMKLKLAPQSLEALAHIQKKLDAIPPKPSSGYTDSKVVGHPHDSSSPERILQRWHVVHDAKAVFRRIVETEEIARYHPPAEPWDLAGAPVAKPGTSQHGTGYAFDIEGAGQNGLIKTICSRLGATLIFDEKSHVHVEFKQGVVINTYLVPDDKYDGRYCGWMHRTA